MLINIWCSAYSWFLSVFGLLNLKGCATWPWCKGWICFSPKTYRIMKILCWSLFAIEPIADFCPFLGYWLSKKFISNNDVKGNLHFMQNLKYLVPLGRYFHLDYFCQKTCSWILTPRPLEERLLTYCFQNLQKHKITLSDTDSFTLQSFIFADFKFVNLTWDLKLGVPRKGDSHQDLFFKIGFLQLQLQSLKFCRTPIFL